MINDRYYYSQLSEKDKLGYRALYDGFQNFEQEIVVRRANCTVSPPELLRAVEADNPHLFYINFTCMEIAQTISDIIFIPQYLYSATETMQLKAKADAAVSKILHRITGTSDYEKEVSLHDLLVKKVRYDNNSDQNLCAYSILGVLLYQNAVCDGIAKTVKLLLNMLGIKCIVANGTDLKKGVPHAWNIVKIQEQAYHVDVTWDITTSKDSGIIRYDYLNLSDRAVLRDHKPAVSYPRCSAEQYNYYARSGAVVHDQAALCQLLAASFSRGDKKVVFQCRELDRSCIGQCVYQAACDAGLCGQLATAYSINAEQSIYGLSIQVVNNT